MRRALLMRALVCIGVIALASPLGAQQSSLDSLRAIWTVKLPPSYLSLAVQPRSLPAMNALTPSAFSPAWGDVFVAAGYQRNTRPTYDNGKLNKEDGAVSFGFGLGTPRLLAMEVVYDSFSTFRSGFFNVGALSFKLSHLFANGWSTAIGAERVVTIGKEGDGGKAYFGAVSKVFFAREGEGFLSSIGVTAGVGDGRFRRYQDWLNEKQAINGFGAVGVRLASSLGVVADWNGQDLNLTASIIPLRCFPVAISPGVADVTGSAGSPPRFIIGVGVGFRPAELGHQLRSCF